MPEIVGLAHIDLTVTDRDRSLAWWQDVLGFVLVNRHHDETFDANSMMHPSGVVVTVLTHHATTTSDRFDERRVGLDHLAFEATDRDELQRWVEHLDSKGIDHSGIIDIGYGPTLVFRDPDNFQLELYVTPDSFEPTL